MKLLRLRRVATVSAVVALMLGGLGLGATSAMADPTGMPTLLAGFPANPTSIVAFQGSHLVVGSDGRLYDWADGTATLVPGAPESITNLAAMGDDLYLLSAPPSDTPSIVRYNGTTFYPGFSSYAATGSMVGFDNQMVSTVTISGEPELEKRGAGGDYSVFYMSPRGIQALTVFQGRLYAAGEAGVWVLSGFDFVLISGTPTDIVDFAAIGDTLYLRSATQIYSLTSSGATSIATLSTTAMTAANGRLYVKRADSSEVLVLGDSGFSALPYAASGKALLSMDGLLIFADDTAVYSYDGSVPPIVSTSPSSVSAAVTPGPLTASLSAVEFAATPFSHDKHTVSTTATLAVDDQTGLLYGWDVTMQASALVWTSPSNATDAARNIPAANLSLAAVTGVTTLTGDTFADGFGGGAALGSAVMVVSTEQGQGSGSYTVPLGFDLAVPANAPAGTYTGTLTTTISAAP